MTTNEYYPLSTDSNEQLQEKLDFNQKATIGEIGCDLVFPERDSNVTEYLSNQIRCREIIEERENNCHKCDIYESNIEMKNNDACCQGGYIHSSNKKFNLFSEIIFYIGIAYYFCLKFIELPLLLNPTTFPIYFSH